MSYLFFLCIIGEYIAKILFFIVNLLVSGGRPKHMVYFRNKKDILIAFLPLSWFYLVIYNGIVGLIELLKNYCREIK